MFHKVIKAIRNPGQALAYAQNKIGALDPTTVTFEQAERFFANPGVGNRELVDAIEPYLATTTALFDVGANSGYFSKEVLGRGYKGRVVLFEPISNLQSIAVRTLAPYPVEKVFVNAALGEANGTLDIFLPNDSNIGWITAVAEKTQNQKATKVAAVAASPFIQAFMPQFVKIDVEGFELFILRPFLDHINDDYRPNFVVELGWGMTNPHWADFLEVARGYIAKGYRFMTADERRADISIADMAALDRTIDVLITG